MRVYNKNEEDILTAEIGAVLYTKISVWIGFIRKIR